MADENVVSEIVTKFFLSTCRLRPQLTLHAIQAVVHCAEIATRYPVDDAEVDFIPLVTGSVAEFYVEPMLPHVGDIDVMYHCSTQLAIPQGHPPPTQLPTEFSNYVKVFEIVDSHVPGYVYLELRYLLTQCVDDGTYNYIDYDRGMYLTNVLDNDQRLPIHGPAVITDFSYLPFLLSFDTVRCLRCLSWPSQAADWPTRHRNYDWPDSATVDRVVSNGCDVVKVAHRQCRQHEWMGNRQWRLSFSRAEIVLINSWMPVQQIVYHMLRYFMKTKRLIDSADNYSERVVVSNYHIKTLMLWASELKPRSWWTESLNLVRICVELLHTLSVCLNDTCCLHYFVNNCNLIDNSLSAGTVASELMSIDEAYLSSWFIYNYIGKCAQRYPDYVQRLCDDANSVAKLQSAVTIITEFGPNALLFHLYNKVNCATYYLLSSILPYGPGLTERSCVCWMNEFARCVHLSYYFSAVAFLHVSYKTSINGFSDDLMDALLTVLGQHSYISRYPKQQCSLLCLNKATNLMKVVANSSRSTMQLIEIELSKAYLYRALRCQDSDSDSTYCLANAYLAVLYYTTGQYQTAIDHCTLVMRSQDHSQCSSHVVQGELLPKIDDDIDTVLGLAVFYQYVLSATLMSHHQHRQYVSVFTTELFAYYLHCRLLSVTQCRQVTQTSFPDISQRCAEYISETNELFIGDVLVFRRLNGALKQNVSETTKWSKCGRSGITETDLNTPELVELLQRSAVKQLTTYRQLVARDFGSVATIVTTDFEALYAYKHGDYQRCLQLSTQNVRTLLYGIYVPNVPTSVQFIQLLDDDIVSLTALTLIVNPEHRHHPGNVFVSQQTLSLYLMTQCQLKLRHSVKSLAQTLDYIKVAQKILPVPVHRTLDNLTLKLAKCKTTTYLRMALGHYYS